MKKILVVDDDPHIREVVSFALENSDYAICEASNGREALQVFAREQPNLLVLDIMMPELDGTEVCRQLRQHSQVPIVFLSARDDDVDMIVGLELGGDDYISKPFSPRQLVARVKAVLRRCQPDVALQQANDSLPELYQRGALTLNSETFKVYWQDAEVILTVTEFKLLQVLIERPEKVFSRDDLMQRAYNNVVVSDRTIDSHIRRVRSKIAAVGGDVIETIHGLGYKLGCSQ